ncbi:MAG: FMN-binding protein [Spirochaetaceae bacterium]|jgi:fumarate reductase flavoprotein subunit|nr:FMN-binding protein [Spirochaetaceae bacterium]
MKGMYFTPRPAGRFTVPAGLICLLVVLSGCDRSPDIYKAGTYTASAAGYGGPITVSVEFDRASILSVAVVEEHETKEFALMALGTLPGKIVEEQKYDVEAVSSASITSGAIKAAVKDCVEQALVKGLP